MMIVDRSKDDSVKDNELLRKIRSTAKARSLAGPGLGRVDRSVAERVSQAFEIASKKTGIFETRYAKK